MYAVSDEYIAAMRAPVRRDKVTGHIKLRDGTVLPIDDSKIIQNKFTVIRKVCGSKFDTGTANCAEMNITLFDESAYGNEYGGALVKLTYSLCVNTAEDKWESVPFPPFWADGKQVTRKRNMLTIKAYDGMSKLDVAMPDISAIPTDNLYNALKYILNYAGLGLALSEDDFNALPNAAVSAALSFESRKIQSCRDAVMWIAQLTSTCAFTDNRGLVTLKRHNYAEAGTYDREIKAQERASIEFADTRTYLAYIAGYCVGERKNYSNVSDVWGTDSVHVREGALNLPENPIIANYDEAAQDAVMDAYFANRSRPTRYIKAQGLIDPAIDPLDNLAFTGGSVDIRRGRLIAPVTTVKWKYRASGYYECQNYEEYTEDTDQSNISAVAAMALDETGNSEEAPVMRVPPKSQTEKEIDELRARLNGAAFPPAPIEYAFNALPNVDPAVGGGFTLKSKDGSTELTLGSGGISVYNGKCSNAAITLSAWDASVSGRSSYINVNPWGINIEAAIDSKNSVAINGTGGVGGSFSIQITADGVQYPVLSGNSSGWYIGGKKILTED